MFANRIRSAAVALAIAALSVTSFASTAAAAPKIHIPVADLVVTPLGLTHDAAYQNVQYRFRVSNNGPDKMTFTLEQKAIWLAYGQYNGTQNQQTTSMTRNAGESFDVTVPCSISGDGHTCGGAEVKVTSLKGLDSNVSNNQYLMQNSFQP